MGNIGFKIKTLMVTLLLCLASMSSAQELTDPMDADGMWHDPENTGDGIIINYDETVDVAFMTWFLYKPDGSTAFVVGRESCDFFPCTIELVEPTASLFGGDLELGPTVGEMTLTQVDMNNMKLEYDLIPWFLEIGGVCDGNMSPTGYLISQCAGFTDLTRLSGN